MHGASKSCSIGWLPVLSFNFSEVAVVMSRFSFFLFFFLFFLFFTVPASSCEMGQGVASRIDVACEKTIGETATAVTIPTREKENDRV
jgi:hypothetical protein